MLRAEGITDIMVRYVADDADATAAALRELAEANDVVLSTGGVSVGDYDFVGTSLEEIGVETVFL